MLPTVRARCPATAVSFVEFLTGVGPVSLLSAEVARRDLFGVMGSHIRHGWIWRMVHAHLHLLRTSPMGGAQVGNLKLHREWSVGSEKLN